MLTASTNRSILVWAWVFVAVNLLFPRADNTNGFSRYALLTSIVEDHSLKIDNYASQTVDWSRTPDGHYYTNKAPGPIFLALPFFVVMDWVTTLGVSSRVDRDEKRHFYRYQHLKLLSLLLQLIPFALLGVWALRRLAEAGMSQASLQLTAAALFFGNTAALFMANFFGHGFSAVTCLAMVLCLQTRRHFWGALCAGFTVLSDYAAPAFLPFLLVPFLWRDRRDRVAFARMACGLVLPVALWVWYHQTCFGSFLTLPQKFQNPEFVDAGPKLWGILALPSGRVLYELLFGGTRGLLWTQPALLVAWLVLFFRQAEDRWLAIGFAGVLLMNASFNGWHGGDTPGPRYLATVLPLLALRVGEIPWRKVTAAGVLFSLLFAVVEFSAKSLPSEKFLLWPYYWENLVRHATLTSSLRVLLLSALLGLGLRRWFQEAKQSG